MPVRLTWLPKTTERVRDSEAIQGRSGDNGHERRSVQVEVRGRWFAISIGLSLVGHAAVIAWLATRDRVPAPVAMDDEPISLEIVSLPELPAVSDVDRDTPVQLPVEPPVRSGPAISISPASRPAAGPAAIPTAATPPTATTPEATPATRPAAAPPAVVAAEPAAREPVQRDTGSLLAMRDSAATRSLAGDDERAPVPALTPAYAARLIEGDPERVPPPRSPLSLPPARVERAPRSELIPNGNGSYRAEDLTFDAYIAADGKVRIEDKPDYGVALAVPSASGLGNALEAWARDPYGKSTEQSSAVLSGIIPMLGGYFDITAWMMRKKGMDPYLRRKVLFLERTREQRAAMSAAERTSLIRDSIYRLPQVLASIWADTALPAAERRRLIFELWDGCAEPPPAGGPGNSDGSSGGSDDEIARAGATARATIMGFVRRTLPGGSEHGYRDSELAALNRRRTSAAPFAPYQP